MQNKLELIWNDFHKELEAFIFSRIKERDITNDILQEIFIKIHNNIGTLKDESKLSSWIYQITRNAVNDYFRKSEPQIEITDYQDIEEHQIPYVSELERCLEPFINQLGDKYKEAIILTELNGLTQKQLAQKLNISYSGAKSRVQRGKENLKKLFTDCCSIQFDKYGNVVDFQKKRNCRNCCD